MRGSRENVPKVVDVNGVVIQLTEWGGMNVVLESFPAGTDTGPIFKGLPDNRCQSSHWGYVLKGRLRVRYANREEVLVEGDAFYMEPGHTTVFEEDTELVEFSPKGEYQETLEVVQRNVAAMQEGQV
jgi:mannose-6-phosphate isomerase-like protein (cupin superfamily)